MALIKTVTTKHGIVLNDAYISIVELSAIRKGKVNIRVGIFASKEASDAGKEFVQQELYTYTPDMSETSCNNFKQGYLFLKTLDKYQDALDVLEEDVTQ